MQAVLVLMAMSLLGQVEPPPRVGPAAKPDPAPVVEVPRTFTLDEIAAGAKNDAFVDEFLKNKQLSLFGQVQRIERVVTPPANDADPLAKAPTTYRLVMSRTGHEDRPLDVDVYFVFTDKARKELALLEPGTAKIAVQGTCSLTQLQTLERGHLFALELRDCQIVATPPELDTNPRPRTPIIPNIIPEFEPPVVPPRPTIPPVPGPPPPPLPMAIP